MSNPSIERLLQPSLSHDRGLRAPYSAATGLLCAFFGGPFAAVAVQLLNGWRLGRWRVDIPLLLIGLAALLALDAWLRHAGGLDALANLLGATPKSTRTLLLRAGSLALFSIGALLHRQAQTTTDLMGAPRPNGLWLGLGLIVAGAAAEVAWTLATA